MPPPVRKARDRQPPQRGSPAARADGAGWAWTSPRTYRLALVLGLLARVGAVAALLLLIVFSLSAPRPAAIVDARLPSLRASLAEDIDALRKQAGDVAGTVAGLQAELTRNAETSKGQRETLDALRKQLGDLQEKLVKLPATLTPAGPSAEAKLLASLRKEIADLRKDYEDRAADLARETEQVKADLGERKKLADEQKKQFDERMDRLERELRQARAPFQPEPADVLVLAMHSENLHINHYLDAFRAVCFDPRLLQAAPRHRVGLSLASGDRYTTYFPLAGGDRKQAEEKFRSIREPPRDSTDRLRERGPDVRAEFEGSGARSRRCVVVTSSRCLPVPAERFAQWDGLTVHVILVGTPGTEESTRRHLDDWLAFCRHCRGGAFIQLTASKGIDEQDPELLERLTYHLRQLTSPLYPVAKREDQP